MIAKRMAGAAAIPDLGAGVRHNTDQRVAINDGKQKRREWRAKTTPATFEGVRRRFDDSGVRLQILCYNTAADIEDDEIDHAFRMAQALKVSAISSTSTVAVARRIAPFADKYKFIWGGHNHAQVSDSNEFASTESLELVLSLSRYFGVNLDIGHYTAANLDAVAFIQKHHSRITNLHLKDRKRNNGKNVPWGQGDTPIKEVLQLMRIEKYTFPANIELEYPIPEGSNSVAEIANCFEYARRYLES